MMESYDPWAELYWKKQIEGNLTEEQQKELEELEKENMKTVKEVYKALKEDVKIKELIEQIKSHKWVKVIEGFALPPFWDRCKYRETDFCQC